MPYFDKIKEFAKKSKKDKKSKKKDASDGINYKGKELFQEFDGYHPALSPKDGEGGLDESREAREERDKRRDKFKMKKKKENK